jgi:hypothetical protein
MRIYGNASPGVREGQAGQVVHPEGTRARDNLGILGNLRNLPGGSQRPLHPE